MSDIAPIRFRFRRVLSALAGLSLGLASLSVLAGPAAADTGADKDVARAGKTNCTVQANTGASRCFATLRESLSYATGGRVTGAPNDIRAAVTDRKLTSQLNERQLAPANRVLGVQYYFENYQSYTLTVWGYGEACDDTLNNVDYYLTSAGLDLTPFGGLNWNNNIRSFIGYNNCWELLYDNWNATGDTFGYAPYSADLGFMRDRAEFIAFS